MKDGLRAANNYRWSASLDITPTGPSPNPNLTVSGGHHDPP